MLISYAHTIKNMYNMTRSFENIIDTEKILCDFSFQNSYMYSSNKQELKNIKDETNAINSLIFCFFIDLTTFFCYNASNIHIFICLFYLFFVYELDFFKKQSSSYLYIYKKTNYMIL